MHRAAYVTDLKTLQEECSVNYWRLSRLLGDLGEGDVREVKLGDQGKHFGALWLEVLEVAPYTTTISISQSGVMDSFVETPRMRVQLYHDVRMAEVVNFQRQRHFDGRYRYPNPRMHQPDEKLQLNRFLGEWLEHGLAHGRSLDLIR